MTITVAAIHRYPVKGLSAEALDRVELAPGDTLPHDRRYALAHGSTSFDPSAPQWQPKTAFLNLMKDEKLAQLRVRFDPAEEYLTIERGGRQVVRAKAGDHMGRMVIDQFFASFMAGSTRGTPRLLEAAGHSFTDTAAKYVSILNLASVRDLERVMRRPVDPLRFRANIHIEGAAAWSELHWTGRDIALGGARVKVEAPIDRCAATNVDPQSAVRDLNVPLTLQRGFGHVYMGIYATVTVAGSLALGDSVTAPD